MCVALYDWISNLLIQISFITTLYKVARHIEKSPPFAIINSEAKKEVDMVSQPNLSTEKSRFVKCPQSNCTKETNVLYQCNHPGCEFAIKAFCELHLKSCYGGGNCCGNGHPAREVWSS